MSRNTVESTTYCRSVWTCPGTVACSPLTRPKLSDRIQLSPSSEMTVWSATATARMATNTTAGTFILSA